MNFTATLKPLVAAAALACAGQALAQVTFYEGEGFRGRALAANRTINNFSEIGFNDRASSVIVERGRWEVCEHANFQGRCVVLKKGKDVMQGAQLTVNLATGQAVLGGGVKGQAQTQSRVKAVFTPNTQ